MGVASNRSHSKEHLAAEVWRGLFDFFLATRSQRDKVLERFGLTPNDARALYSLDARQGKTMRSLAEAWGCDPSNATFMVDRLERRGLAERRPHPGDRRVKRVVLTSVGAKTKVALASEMYRPPPELLALERSDLEALRAAIARLSNTERSSHSAERDPETQRRGG
jgi:DNA-binding MarR family transcriptional regulator